MKKLAALVLMAITCGFIPAPGAEARSFLSPRRSGMESPDGPRQSPLPGMTGHMDAYGNALTDRMPEERKKIHRPRPGAYGGPPKQEREASLPDAPAHAAPVWNFR